MTADLKEAFALAAVEFLIWSRQHEEFRTWGGCYVGEDAQGGYIPEPTVHFFGQDLPISAICARAAILSGSLPSLIRSVFAAIDNGFVGIEPQTYKDAVLSLQVYIEEELEAQRRYSLTEFLATEGTSERKGGHVATDYASLVQRFKRHGKLFGLTPDEWHVMLVMMDGGW